MREHYLADPGNPYRGSGRSSGAERWEETRRPIADAVVRSGSFLDVGCANGLLLESVVAWTAERGLGVEPHGIDIVPELVMLARRRIPEATLAVANAWDWHPPRRYDVVRTSIEIVPEADRATLVRRHRSWVERGGRLVVCWYPDRGAPPVDLPALLESWGLPIGAVLRPDDHAIVWVPA